MTDDDFRAYVDAFNRADFDGFGRLYADDVVFELGSRKRIEGRENILAFYRQVRAHLDEHIELRGVLIGARNVAMYCRTTFTTLVDWPDYEFGATVKGDVREVETIAWYELDESGKRFTHIRGGRFKP